MSNLKSNVDKLDIDKVKNVPSNFNSNVDKLDIGKLETISVDLSKPGNVEQNYLVEKTEYDELDKAINAIQTTNTIDWA